MFIVGWKWQLACDRVWNVQIQGSSNLVHAGSSWKFCTWSAPKNSGCHSRGWPRWFLQAWRSCSYCWDIQGSSRKKQRQCEWCIQVASENTLNNSFALALLNRNLIICCGCRTVLIANNVSLLNKEANAPIYSPEDLKTIKKIAERDDTFDLLGNSLAPSIHGHSWIKKAVILLMLGGVEKNLKNGTHLRGLVLSPYIP